MFRGSMLFVAMVIGLLALPKSARAADGKLRFFIGTYTNAASKGIYLAEMDANTGALALSGLAAEAASPSFLALHPTGKYLYAVNETQKFENENGGGVTAFAIDPKTARLTLLNQQPTGGADPCHLAVDSTGKALVVANYTGGSVASFPIGPDGSLGKRASLFEQKGHSVNAKRQEGSHAHCTVYGPESNSQAVYVADLGLDKVLKFTLDAAHGALSPPMPAASLPAGSGPRHLAFSPSGKFVYVISELASTVSLFAYDGKAATFEALQTISTLPTDFKGESTCAEIAVHPSGKFVYGSNRGHDSIAAYKVDEATGKLTSTGYYSTQGKTPRNFAIDPTGKFLLAANQDSGTIVVFKIDLQSGALEPTGNVLKAPSPVCIVFLPG